MQSSLFAIFGATALFAGHAAADFGVWRIQESVVGSGVFEYPLLTGGDVQSGVDVYNYWADHSHWYDLPCDGCGNGDSIHQNGGMLYVGESYKDEGYRLKFESIPDGAAKDACSQLLGITCDYRILRNGEEDVGGCEYGGHSLSFTENTMGVLAHIDGFRHLWCSSQQVSF